MSVTIVNDCFFERDGDIEAGKIAGGECIGEEADDGVTEARRRGFGSAGFRRLAFVHA